MPSEDPPDGAYFTNGAGLYELIGRDEDGFYLVDCSLPADSISPPLKLDRQELEAFTRVIPSDD